MKNVKLSTKILGMAGFFLFLLVGANCFSIIKMNRIGNEVEGLAERDIPLTETVSEITEHQILMSLALERAMRFGGVQTDAEVAKEGLQDAKGHMQENAERVEALLTEGEEIAVKAARNAKSEEARQEFVHVDTLLKNIDAKKHAYVKRVDSFFTMLHSGQYAEAGELAIELEEQGEGIETELGALLEEIEKFTDQAAMQAHEDEESAFISLIVLTAISLLLGIFISITTYRSIARPVSRAVASLGVGADEVAAASGQIAASSEQLAQGATEQAASLEETSASLEEMTSMVQMNANHSEKANVFVNETNEEIDRLSCAMNELSTAMSEISEASVETNKIIKTIDDIAFQTNLLALNAAVEAARAGEAGSGFAVVADEVRNLAGRAAEAAKETSSLIDRIVDKVKGGTQLLHLSSELFTGVADKSKSLGGLIGEISSASSEQAEGINQINRAVQELDQVTQSNTSSAEESASASEELQAQAENLKKIVADLVAIVHGSGERKEGGQRALAFNPSFARARLPQATGSWAE